jgi:hypothetical protein
MHFARKGFFDFHSAPAPAEMNRGGGEGPVGRQKSLSRINLLDMVLRLHFPARNLEVLMKSLKGWIVTTLAGTLMLAAPAFAAPRGGHGGGGFSHGGGGQHFSGRSFRGPSRGFYGGRGYEGRGFEHGGMERGYVRGGGWGFGGGIYPGYAYPYGYGYPYGYDPYYAAPAPAPACNPNGGYYDANGNWIPDPNCGVPPPYGY